MYILVPLSAVSRHWRFALYALACASLLIAACGGDDDDDGGNSATAPAATTPTGASNRIQVVAQDIAFSPTRLTAPAGQDVTIVFTNNDASVPHNFHILDTGDKTEIFTGDQGPSAELVVRFDQPGEYQFQCDVHPTIMAGTIVVE